jgi:hypothetical protein
MPLVIKDPRTQKVLADGVIGNTIRCGHCDMPIVDNTTWIALDDPYFCLVHETCSTLFKYNSVMRSATSLGRQEARSELDSMQRELHRMIQGAWWQKSASTKRYHHALQQMLLLHQSLRTSRVIVDADNKDDAKL